MKQVRALFFFLLAATLPALAFQVVPGVSAAMEVTESVDLPQSRPSGTGIEESRPVSEEDQGAAPAAEAAAGATVMTESKEAPAAERVSFEEMHKRTVIVMAPSAYAAYVGGTTGENFRVFLSWYIGTLSNETGLYIAPIFSLLVGVDGKWAFLEERKGIPAMAAGYYGGLAVPFTGGAVRAVEAAEQKQTFLHNIYGVMSKQFGPLTFSGGAMYGLKKPFPIFIPMLRNSTFTASAVTPSDRPVTVFGGMDFVFKQSHFKIEVLTVPDETENRPWLVQTHIDGFLGFDLAYLKDAVGYEIIGYYLLPFFRWPDKKQLEKEIDRAKAPKP